MPDRRVYDVVPDGGGWTVRERGASADATQIHEKVEAVTHARALASGRGRAEVLIYGRDGKLQNRFVYGTDEQGPHN